MEKVSWQIVCAVFAHIIEIFRVLVLVQRFLHDCATGIVTKPKQKILLKHIHSVMAKALLKWGGGGGKSNDQIPFACNPYLACPHVTCPIHVGFRPTVLASCITIRVIMTSKI